MRRPSHRGRTTSTRAGSRRGSGSSTRRFRRRRPCPARIRLRLRPRRPRGAARRGEGRGAAGRARCRLFGQGRRHEPGDAADDRPCDGAEAGRLGGRPARPVRVRRDDPHACAFRSASERSSSGAGPSRSRCRATRTSATCARTSARRRVAGQGGRLGRLAAPLVRPGRGSARRDRPEAPGARAASRSSPRRAGRGGRSRRRRRDRPYGLTAPPDRPRRRALIAGEGAGSRRARAGRGVRCPDARRTARAVPADRGLMSSGPALTVRAMQRLRTLSEAECYARCYGWRGEDGVRLSAPSHAARATRRPSPASCSAPCSKTSSTPENLKPPKLGRPGRPGARPEGDLLRDQPGPCLRRCERALREPAQRLLAAAARGGFHAASLRAERAVRAAPARDRRHERRVPHDARLRRPAQVPTSPARPSGWSGSRSS